MVVASRSGSSLTFGSFISLVGILLKPSAKPIYADLLKADVPVVC